MADAVGPVNVVNSVKVEGSAGVPAQNDDLAKQMVKSSRRPQRGLAVDEMRHAARLGNMANQRGDP
jgi:hypothetical protein